MRVAEKTYTFRAAGDLGPRAREALSTLSALLDEEGGVGEEAMSAFWMTVLRHARDFKQPESQSAVFRTTLETFIDAAEKLARDREHVSE